MSKGLNAYPWLILALATILMLIRFIIYPIQVEINHQFTESVVIISEPEAEVNETKEDID